MSSPSLSSRICSISSTRSISKGFPARRSRIAWRCRPISCQCIHLAAQNLFLAAFSQPVVHCTTHDLRDAGAFLLGDLYQGLVLFGVD
jgi:hypothetical protein